MNGHYEWHTMNDEYDLRIFSSDNMCFDPHLHMQYEIFYVTHGYVQVAVNGEIRELGKDELCVILGNDVHSYHTDTESRAMLMIFNENMAPDFSNRFHKMRPVSPFVYPGENAGQVHYYFNAAMQSYYNHDNKLILHGNIYILLGLIMDMLQLYEESSLDNDTIRKVLNYLEQNYDGNISLEYVAKEIGVSRYYISRLFNSRMGCSFNQYLNSLRINRARRLLSTDKNITEISFESGFESTRTFHRAFKEICGVTPKQLRSQIKDDRKIN